MPEQTIRQVTPLLIETISPISINTQATRLIDSAILTFLNSSLGSIVCMMSRYKVFCRNCKKNLDFL